MVNPLRGEVEITLDGIPHAARLTLGALAELEAALQTSSLIEMAARFEEGKFSASDMVAVIVAGLAAVVFVAVRVFGIAVPGLG